MLDINSRFRIEHVASVSLETHPCQYVLKKYRLEGAPLLLIVIDHTCMAYFNLIVLSIVLSIKNLIVHVLRITEEEISMEHVDGEFLTDLIPGAFCDCEGDL